MQESQSIAEFMRYAAPDAAAHARGISEVRRKLDRAISENDRLATVDHAADLASMLTTDRRELEALHLLGEHAALADAFPGEEPSGWFWNAYATALQYAGNRAEADACFAKAHGLCSTAGWARLEALVLHHWGRNLAEQGRFPEAEARISQALAIRIRLDDPRQESSSRALKVLGEYSRQFGRDTPCPIPNNSA